MEARTESESRANARGVRRKLGRTEGVLGTKHRKQRVRPVEQHPGADAVISLRRRAKAGNQPEVSRHNVTNGVRRDAPGSLSGFVVLPESRRTEPWEPGSREGNRLVEAAPGRRSRDTEPAAFVHGTDAGGDGGLPSTGRTVCGKSARTGLWGSRRVTAGSTRKNLTGNGIS